MKAKRKMREKTDVEENQQLGKENEKERKARENKLRDDLCN